MSARDCTRCKRAQRASIVVDSRVYTEGQWLGMAFRRRECINCGHRWSTLEVMRDEYVPPEGDSVTLLRDEYDVLVQRLMNLQALAQIVADTIERKGGK